MTNLKNDAMVSDKVLFDFFLLLLLHGTSGNGDVSVGNALEAELWCMYDGLKMAWDSSFRKIIIKTDSISVIQLLSKAIPTNHPLFSIVVEYSALMAADWSCALIHVYREENRVADGLAHLRMSTVKLFLLATKSVQSDVFRHYATGNFFFSVASFFLLQPDLPDPVAGSSYGCCSDNGDLVGIVYHFPIASSSCFSPVLLCRLCHFFVRSNWIYPDLVGSSS
ncbi:hypothetical protein LWI28_019458 [Acer negundo]|uniref:RNase H type-1 domain-containing protein n=1 Tax=Acer negundo TaxID=4023 RepID=A0AAD5IVI4_ACENE|nr:hypothetical protein LWI28_019458 [Acer negundo]